MLEQRARVSCHRLIFRDIPGCGGRIRQRLVALNTFDCPLRWNAAPHSFLTGQDFQKQGSGLAQRFQSAAPRNVWNTVTISVVGIKKKLRRVSCVVSQIGRRPLELAPAAFSLCQAVFVTARRSNGWRNVAVSVPCFHVEFEHTKSIRRISARLV